MRQKESIRQLLPMRGTIMVQLVCTLMFVPCAQPKTPPPSITALLSLLTHFTINCCWSSRVMFPPPKNYMYIKNCDYNFSCMYCAVQCSAVVQYCNGSQYSRDDWYFYIDETRKIKVRFVNITFIKTM